MKTAFEELTAINVVEFVNRLKHSLTEHKQRVTWFLGAGCSVSSGIPTAGGLVERWLRDLAVVLRGEATIDILDQHSEWRAVPAPKETPGVTAPSAKLVPAIKSKASAHKEKKPRG
jgi:hypothetical protein